MSSKRLKNILVTNSLLMMSTPDQFEQDALSEQDGKKLKIYFASRF